MLTDNEFQTLGAENQLRTTHLLSHRPLPNRVEQVTACLNAAAHLISGTRKYERGLSRLMHDVQFFNLEFPMYRSLNLRLYREPWPSSRGCVHALNVIGQA